MQGNWLIRGRAACVRLAGWLPRLWVETALGLPAVPRGLDVLLAPSRAARAVGLCFYSGLALYALELTLTRHALAAAAVLGTACAAHLWRWSQLRRADGPRRLLVGRDGRLHLFCVSGAVQSANIDRTSLRLGRWLLLRLVRDRGAALYLVLGPDNVEPAALAALHRRVHGAAAQTPAAPAGVRHAGSVSGS